MVSYCPFESSKDSITDAEMFVRGATTEGVSSMLLSHKRVIESAYDIHRPGY